MATMYMLGMHARDVVYSFYDIIKVLLYFALLCFAMLMMNLNDLKLQK